MTDTPPLFVSELEPVIDHGEWDSRIEANPRRAKLDAFGLRAIVMREEVEDVKRKEPTRPRTRRRTR